MKMRHLIITTALLVLPRLASAQDSLGPNGGQITDVKGHHIEFTMRDSEIVLFLWGAGNKPIDTKGTTGRIVVLDGGKQSSTDLSPAEPNILSAKLEAAPAAGAKVVVAVRHSDGHELQARFVTK